MRPATPHYGWKRDTRDDRDLIRRLTAAQRVPLAPSTSNKTRNSFLANQPAWDQLQLGSCTSHGNGGGWCFTRAKQGLPFIMPSRLFIYYNERVVEGSVDSDDGAQVRTGIKVLVSQGVCPESDWTYDDGPTKFRTKPPAGDYAEALGEKAIQYSRVTQSPDLYYVRHCLDILGLPVVFGFDVYDFFESDEMASIGIVKMPTPGTTPLGGHCTLAVDYDDSRQAILVRNSWGADWAINGYFWMPYAYFSNPTLTSDLWTLELVQSAVAPIAKAA